MPDAFEQTLRQYAEVTVHVGLNLQPGQRLLIGAPVLTRLGVPLELAPLIRLIATQAYAAGAKVVEVIWSDDELQLARYQHAPADSFDEFPTWLVDGALQYAQRGDAFLSCVAEDPDLLAQQDPAVVARVRQAAVAHTRPVLDYLVRNAVNWTVISAPVAGWAAKVFPELPPAEQMAHLWDAIFEVCRVKHADPLAAWHAHIQQVVARSAYLNHQQYTALRFTAPGTYLTIGLPRGHRWGSARFTSAAGIPFIANLPTEEVFTLPHREYTEGVVTASLPLSYGGTVIAPFRLTFAQGRVVDVSAGQGEAVLRRLLETDAGAGRLGEVALVPHSSPIARLGRLFYNTLLDENAASHLALGQGLKSGLQGGEALSDEAFTAVGGNHSLVHVDFMIGSAAMAVDGIRDDGTAEPVMRGGEWAFET